ncbi:MAG: hypothetical protein LBE80_05690 [Deltaproteobacteria bacterium]|jgi:DNA-directed RNA polymerase subunit RPC12/RpoP|nr:hypothetical protein [Deltaproteobacteria bacterium]
MELICGECGAPIGSELCEKCHQPRPIWAKFCPHCGQEVLTKASPGKKKAPRRLCPDESCIGIIGPDGLCTDCGRRA